MRTLLALLVAAVALNAVAHGGIVAWEHFSFTDEAENILTFGAAEPPEELHGRIRSVAADHGIRLEAEALNVTRDTVRTTAQGSYARSIEFFPGYVYPATLSFEVDALLLAAAPRLDGRPADR